MIVISDENDANKEGSSPCQMAGNGVQERFVQVRRLKRFQTVVTVVNKMYLMPR